MGNRAVIKFEGEKCGIYLHWNGGRDSVEAFLTYCKLRNFRDGDYGIARMAQIVGNFFGGVLSIGIIDTSGSVADLDPGDNGVYTVKNWEIVGRYPRDVQEQREYDLNDFLLDIDKAQPEKERLGEEFLKAKETPTDELAIGDEVFVQGFDGGYTKCKIVGFDRNRWVNGGKEVPRVDLYGSDNPNNLLSDPTYRKAVKEEG